MEKKHSVIIGASSGIAQAIALKLIQNQDHDITLLSRDFSHSQLTASQQVSLITMADYQESSIEAAISQISATTIDQVFICHGILHSDSIKPERRLEDISTEAFNAVIAANTLTPILWIKHLVKRLGIKHRCNIAVFNARVGSISENELGGWYSYRTSKAALNMLLKTAAIELARRAKNIKLISFHPGTTDTPLSKPFQKNVAQGKLFTPKFVAEQLIDIVENSKLDGQLSYLDWKGEAINF